MKRNKENYIYMLMQGSYWMLYCCYYGYVTYFLMQKGFATGTIALMLGGFGILSALLQPCLGRVADRTRAGWKLPLIIMISLIGAASVGIAAIDNMWVQGILFASGMMLLGGSMPLLNSASFRCESAGKHVDFAKARGIGSLGYAILSVILGKLTVAYGEWVVPVAAVASTVCFLVTTLLLKDYSPLRTGMVLSTSVESGLTDGVISGKKETKSRKGFLIRYPAFMIMWLSCICMLAFHNMTNAYLIQMFDAVGGDSNSLGIAHAIAAVLELPVMFGYAKIRKHAGASKLLIVAACAFVIKAVMYYISGSVAMMYFTQFFQMFSFALFASASVYYAEEVMAPEDKATGQAFMSNTVAIGYVMGSFIGGELIEAVGLKGMLAAAIAFTAASAVFAVLANVIRKPERA